MIKRVLITCVLLCVCAFGQTIVNGAGTTVTLPTSGGTTVNDGSVGVGTIVDGYIGGGLPKAGLVGQWAFGNDNLWPNSGNAALWNGNGYYNVATATGVKTPDGYQAFTLSNKYTGTHAADAFQQISMWATLYEFSVVVKAKEVSWIWMEVSGGTINAWFDISNGVVGTIQYPEAISASIVPLGNGWYRCSVMVNANNSLGLYGANRVFAVGGSSGDNTVNTIDQLNAAFYVAQPQITEHVNPWVDVNAYPSRGYVETTALTTVPDISGNNNTLTLTGTGFRKDASIQFDGSTNLFSGIPAKGAAWTVVNCNSYHCYGVDSAAGSYIDGKANAGATEFNLGSAGAYTGDVTYRLQYSKILNSYEEYLAYDFIKTEIRKRRIIQHQALPVVTFSLDDGYSSDYVYVKPVFDAEGVLSVSNIITGSIDTGGRLSSAQVQGLYAAGWEIGSHSIDGTVLDQLSLANLRTALNSSKAALSSLGVNPSGIAYPGGNNNQLINYESSKVYTWGRSAGGTGQNLPPLKQYSIAAIDLGALKTSYATFTGYVDTCLANSSWLVFYNHQTDATWQTPYTNLIDYIKSKSIPIKTMSGALDYMKNPFLK